MSTTTDRPVVKITECVRTYMGARAKVTEINHDKKATGLRTIITEWLDDATPHNGGWTAGTIVSKVVHGDGRRLDFEIVEAEKVVA